MHVSGIGVALPEARYSQIEVWEAMQASSLFPGLAPRSQRILKKVLGGDNGIETRHFVLDSLESAFELTPDVLQARFALHAPALGARAATRALGDAGCGAAAIDALIVSTCTGFLCPGLSSYVSERLGLRPDALLLDLVGQGCGAALPGLRTAEALIASGRCRRVLSVCVEICSAALYLDDDPGVLISACLFGDGAAAAVLSDEPRARGRTVRWHSARTLLAPESRDALRFEHRGGMLRNILRPDVPVLAAVAVKRLLGEALAQAGLVQADIEGWVMHGGGRDVLSAIEVELGLQPADFDSSREILRSAGNISSPFVLFALDHALRAGRAGGWWWMCSFGAGFSCHGALLEVGG